MPIFTNAGGAWKSVAPQVKVGSTWKPVSTAYVNVNGVWKPSYQNVPTFMDAPIIAIKNVDNKYAQVAVRMPETGQHRTDIRRIRITAKIGGTGYTYSPEVGVYKQPNKAGETEWWSDVWFNNQGVGTDGKQIIDKRVSGNWVYKQFAPTYKSGNVLKPSTRYAFMAWAQHIDGTWSDVSLGFTTSSKSGSAVSDYNKNYTYTSVFYPKRVGTMTIATKTFVEGRGLCGGYTMAWFDYGPQIRGIISNSANLDFWNRLDISRVAADGGEPTSRVYAGRIAAGVSDLTREPVFMTEQGSETVQARISKGERKAFEFPKAWRNNLADTNSWEGFGILLYPQDHLNTYAVYNSVEEDPYQGRLYIRWMN